MREGKLRRQDERTPPGASLLRAQPQPQRRRKLPGFGPLSCLMRALSPPKRSPKSLRVSCTRRASGCAQSTTVGSGSRRTSPLAHREAKATSTSIRPSTGGPGTSRLGDRGPTGGARGLSIQRSVWPSGRTTGRTSSGDARSRRTAGAEEACVRCPGRGREARGPTGTLSAGQVPVSVRGKYPAPVATSSAVAKAPREVARRLEVPGDSFASGRRRREQCPVFVSKGGGGVEGDRTPDLRTASAALSQLSYDPG
jgi:hypothetical protein